MRSMLKMREKREACRVLQKNKQNLINQYCMKNRTNQKKIH